VGNDRANEISPYNMGAGNTKKNTQPNRRPKWLENPTCDEVQALYRKPNIVTTIKFEKT
jgi:hypothetical protein